MTIGVEQFAQLRDLLHDIASTVGVSHLHALARHLHDLHFALDVRAVDDGLPRASERLVLYQLESSGVIDQCVSGDAGGLVIGFSKSAVNHHQASFGFDGCLACSDVHGHVSVDDVPVFALHAESVHDAVAHFGIVAQPVVGTFYFLVQRLVGEEVALEGGHAAFVEERALRSAPEIPKVVFSPFLIGFGGICGEGRAHDHADALHELQSLIALAFEGDFLERAVIIHWHGGVKEQIRVDDGVHASVIEETFDVTLQFFAHSETVVQLSSEIFLRLGQSVRLFPVHRGEVARVHGVCLAVELIDAFFGANVVERADALHHPVGMGLGHLLFQLELQDAHGLVHTGQQQLFFLVHGVLVFCQLGHEFGAWVIAVVLHGEGGQRHEVDAVSVFQRGHVAEAQREAQHVHDAAVVTCCSAHPQSVVVAPLYVEVFVFQQHIHDEVCARSPVEYIAQDVQLVNGQMLYHVTEGFDDVAGLLRRDDGLNDAVDVVAFVFVLGVFVEQLFQDVGELLRQRFAHFAAGVFRGDDATHFDESEERCFVPRRQIVFCGRHQFQLLFGVVDERAQFPDFLLREGLGVALLNLTLDGAGGVLEDVLEGFVLSVYVGHEVLRAFGQVEDGFQVDDFRAGCSGVGEALREQFEDASVLFHLPGHGLIVCAHFLFPFDCKCTKKLPHFEGLTP